MAENYPSESKRVQEREIRCPRLGGPVPFGYCVAPGESRPCYKILDCWWEVFDVVSYLKAHMPEGVLETLLQERKPAGRLTAILEVVEKFKKSKSS